MNKLVRYFPNSDLRMGYDGLYLKAKKQGLDLSNLPQGHFVAFVNTGMNKVKLCTQNDVLAYLRRTHKIDPRVIQHLPEYFNGQTLDYDKATEKMLRKSFPKWFEKAKE